MKVSKAIVFMLIIFGLYIQDSYAGTKSDTSNTSVIDVLVVYTTRAKNHVGGTSNIQNLINDARNQTNQSFINSGINATINIVYTTEVSSSYSELGHDICENRDHLANQDGIIDEVRTWRETYNADIVSMLVHNTDDSAHWGCSMTQDSPVGTSQPERAYNVVQVDRATSKYTFTHELGHIFSVSHNVQAYCGLEGLAACGYFNGVFNTIMGVSNNAYNRILYWSNPNLTYNGYSLGDSVSNSAGMLNVMASIVANYRTGSPDPCFSVGTLFCDVPTNYWAYNEINSLYNSITRGCTSQGQPYYDLPFCPEELLDRAHMAVFLVRHLHGNNINYQPPGPYIGYFTDVPFNHPQALWIEELYTTGITVGSTSCAGSGLRYCPGNIVTRGEIASFLMRTERYLNNIPDYESLTYDGVFDDVPLSNPHAKAIEYMYWRGWTNGATCSSQGFTFCPDIQLSRATVAVFMARIFGFVSVQSVDAYEPDNLWYQANWIAANESQIHSIFPSSDEDWLAFSLSSNSAVDIETYGGSDDTRMWLLDSNLNQIEYDDDDGDGYFSKIDRLCNQDSLPPGTYYLKLDEYGNNDYIARYGINFQITQVCNSAPDTYEPDNTYQQAPWLYPTASPQINAPDPFLGGPTLPQVKNVVLASDQDWVKFTIDEPLAITLEIYSAGNDDTRMWLYDSNLNEIEYDDDDGPGYLSWIRRDCGTTLLPPGLYYVKIDEYGNNNVIPNYQLSLLIEPCGFGFDHNVYIPIALR